jgi:hypothetical protein
MLGIVEILEVAGTYLGKSKVRPGMEKCLAPIEKKRLSRGDEFCPLDLNRDGTFLHKGTTSGVFEVRGDKISFQPKKLNGQSLESMQQAAIEAGRAFGLAWLFDPFELQIVGETLQSTNPGGVVYVEYTRAG